VLRAIASGDAARAIALMTDHLESCERRLRPAEAAAGLDLREALREPAMPARGAAGRLRNGRKRLAATRGARHEATP
jgi:hypothetical protein